MMEQNQVIERFLELYNRVQHTMYIVSSYPDEANRASKDIDAIAEEEGHPTLAIEHTKILTLKDQKRESAWFMKAFGSLEAEFANALPRSVSLVFPYKSVVLGQRWKEIRDAIRRWLVSAIPSLPVGRSDPVIPGVPFKLTVWCRQEGRSLLLSRWEPVVESRDSLKVQIGKQLSHKYETLGWYRASGATSILLLESDDIALVNWASLYRAFLFATEDTPRPDLDQVWMACTHLNDCEVCCFAGPEELMECANPPGYQFGRQHQQTRLGDFGFVSG